MTAYTTENVGTRNYSAGYGNASQQNGWQAYYNYAQQLYNVGEQQQAQQYYNYAQQLYSAELQKEQQAAPAYAAQTTYQKRESTPDYGDRTSNQRVPQTSTENASETPSWEAYYNYAQQLYQAGYQEQAEAYYAQAQQLYSQASNPAAEPQPSTATASYSPSAQPSTYMTTETDAQASTAYPSQSDDGEYEEISIFSIRSKWSLKRRLKFWSVISLVLLIGAFWGFFFLYKRQLNDKVDASSDDSVLGTVHAYTIQPVINVLRPAFDKTIRLSLAAQPLLYELNLRDALPDSVRDLNRENDATADKNDIVAPTGEPAGSSNAVEGAAPPVDEDKAATTEEAASSSVETKSQEQPSGASEAAAPDDSSDKTPAEASPSKADSNSGDTKSEDAATVESSEKNPEKKAVGRAGSDRQSSKIKRGRHKARRDRRHQSRRTTGRVHQKSDRGLSAAERRQARRNAKKNTRLSDDPLGTLNI